MTTVRVWGRSWLRARRLLVLGWLGVLGALAHGCAAEVGGVENTELAQDTPSALTGGTTTPTSGLLTSGVVTVQTRRGNTIEHCSGGLVSNRWVLTARHCFCQSDLSALANVTVSVYGSVANGADPTLGQVVTSGVERIVRHDSYDVALVRLDRALPFANVPQIWAGTGASLVGLSVVAGGFGLNRFDSQGNLVGAGESLNTSPMRIDRLATTASETTYPNDCSPAESVFASDGPWTRPPAGSSATTQGGDSGSPLFLGTDPNTRVLVGVLRGSSWIGVDRYNTYTGIWKIRDWIRSNTDISRRDACPRTMPSSANATNPAIARGPGDSVHIVAIQGAQLGHWRIQADGTAQKLGTIPNVTTQSFPALGMEATAAPGQSQKLGLAARQSNGFLRYLRWSEDVGWSAPIDTTIYSRGAPAMANGGVIAVVDAASRAGVTRYDPATGSFAPVTLVPASAPNVDSLKRISVIAEPAFGITVLGYRTASNQWQQISGSSTCTPVTGSYFCAPDSLIATDWSSAQLVYSAGERLAMVTTRKKVATDALPTLENRVTSGQTSYAWGENKLTLPGEPAAATVGNNTWVAWFDAVGLRVAKSDNCFSNDW